MIMQRERERERERETALRYGLARKPDEILDNRVCMVLKGARYRISREGGGRRGEGPRRISRIISLCFSLPGVIHGIDFSGRNYARNLSVLINAGSPPPPALIRGKRTSPSCY